MKVKIFRRSNEGFKNYNQSHIKNININGCYCFIDRILENGIIYNNNYKNRATELGLKDRSKEALNSIEINDATIVYARNVKIESFHYDKYGVDIVRGKINLNYADDSFIPIKLKDVVNRLRDFQKHEYTCKECDLGMSGAYDWEFYEIILDLNKIK